MPRWTEDELRAYLRRVATEANCVAPDAVNEQDTLNVPAGKDERKAFYSGFCRVSITSYRIRLCDVRNLWDKHFVDSLVYAGILRGDSPKDIHIQVEQQQVATKHEERTEVTIEPI